MSYDINKLIADLGSGNERITKEATRKLIEIGPLVVPAILEAIQSGNAHLCKAACWVLVEIKDESVVAPLLKLLESDDWSKAECAATVLGYLGGSEVIPALQKALYVDNWIIRWAAAYALSHRGAAALPALEDAVLNWDEKISRDAAQALKLIGPPAIPVLEKALRSETKEVRENAISALDGINDPRVTALLVEALNEEEQFVRLKVADALASRGTSVIPLLTAALKDETLCRGAAETLYKIGFDKIGEYERLLCNLLLDMDDSITQLYSPPIPSLITALKTENYTIRAAAAHVLNKIGLDNIDFEDRILCLLLSYAKAVDGLGEIATPYIIKNLKDKDGCVQRNATDALVRMAEKTEIDLRAVERALKEYVDSVRRDAPVRIAEAERQAAGCYMKISAAVRKQSTLKHLSAGDGLMLEGAPKLPRDKMYRSVREARVFA